MSAQLNQDYDNQFRTRSYGAPHWSSQKTEDFGTNLRIRGKNDVVSAFDNAPITVDKGGGLDFSLITALKEWQTSRTNQATYH